MWSHWQLINPRRACAARVTVVGSFCLSVCLSVCLLKSHLTYGASVRPENAVTYSAGNEGQKLCGVFSETAPLQRSSTASVVRPCVQSAIFPCVYAHAYFSCIYAHDTPPRVQHFSSFWIVFLHFYVISSNMTYIFFFSNLLVHLPLVMLKMCIVMVSP